MNRSGIATLKLLLPVIGVPLVVGETTYLLLQNVQFEVGAAEIFRVAGAVIGLWMTLVPVIFWRMLRRLEDRVDAIPELVRASQEETANRVTGPILDLETRVRDLERGH